MSSFDELKEELTETLSAAGLLQKIKAELRVGVFRALSDTGELDDLEYEDLKRFKATSEGPLALLLLREMLARLKLNFTLEVLDAEADLTSLSSEREAILGSFSKSLGTVVAKQSNFGLLPALITHHNTSTMDNPATGSIAKPPATSTTNITPDTLRAATWAFNKADTANDNKIMRSDALVVLSDLFPSLPMAQIQGGLKECANKHPFHAPTAVEFEEFLVVVLALAQKPGGTVAPPPSIAKRQQQQQRRDDDNDVLGRSRKASHGEGARPKASQSPSSLSPPPTSVSHYFDLNDSKASRTSPTLPTAEAAKSSEMERPVAPKASSLLGDLPSLGPAKRAPHQSKKDDSLDDLFASFGKKNTGTGTGTGQGQVDGSVKRGSDADSGVPTISSLLQRKSHEDNSKLTKETDTRGANEPTKATLAETTRDKDTSYSSDDASMSIEEEEIPEEDSFGDDFEDDDGESFGAGDKSDNDDDDDSKTTENQAGNDEAEGDLSRTFTLDDSLSLEEDEDARRLKEINKRLDELSAKTSAVSPPEDGTARDMHRDGDGDGDEDDDGTLTPTSSHHGDLHASQPENTAAAAEYDDDFEESIASSIRTEDISEHFSDLSGSLGNSYHDSNPPSDATQDYSMESDLGARQQLLFYDAVKE